MRIVEQSHVIDFVKEKIVYRFDFPEMITVYRDLMFIGELFMECAEKGIKILYSTTYYAQVIGKVEATNKIINNVI